MHYKQFIKSIDYFLLILYNRYVEQNNKGVNFMENEELYMPDIISVTDEDGNEIEFELLERYETEDNVYVAITEYRDDDEDIVEGDFEVIILKVVDDGDGNEYLEEIQDEMEYEQVSDILMAMVEEKYEVEYFEPDEEQ